MSSASPHPPTTPDSLDQAYRLLLTDEALWQGPFYDRVMSLLRSCAHALQADSISVWRFSSDERTLHCRYHHIRKERGASEFTELHECDHPAFFLASAHQRLISLDHPQNDPRTASLYYERPNAPALLDLAVKQGPQSYGRLRIERCDRNWSEIETDYASAIADLFAQVLLYHALEQAQSRHRDVLDSIRDAVFLMRNSRTLDCNSSALRLFGCPFDFIATQPPERFSAEYQADGQTSTNKAQEYMSAALAGRPQTFEWRHRRADGTEFDAEVTLSRIDLSQVPHLIACVRDITERRQSNAEIERLVSLQTAIFNAANYSIISTDISGTILSFNLAAERMLGYSAEEVVGTVTPLSLHDAEELGWRAVELSAELEQHVEPNFDVLTAYANRQRPEEREWTYIRKDGSRLPVMLSVTAHRVNGKDVSGYLCIASDISERKKANEQLLDSKREMEHRANHDELTGLPNRARLHDMAHAAIVSAQARAQNLALMLIDLDRFKEVNDTLGHAIGDKLLQQIAVHLDSLLRKRGAQLYRLGGDEFAVLVPNAQRTEDVLNLASHIHQQLRHPVRVDGITLELGGSVGISLFPTHGDNSHSLLRCADVAMYKAKAESSRTVVYQADQDSHSPRRLSMMGELGTAIREHQLILFYQPRIDIATQTCLGCEALLRWQHPRLGLVPPGEFIPLAEMSDLIQPLGLWVLDHAIAQARVWHKRGLQLVVSVNLSTRNLMDATFPHHIAQLLERYQLPPHLLEIEITESTLIGDPERALQIINRIHRLGVRFAIDDFGTGYSSLSYLKRLPIHTLKIDRSFISDMLTDDQDLMIVKSTLGLAHSFALEVVAEGVEDLPTLEMLKTLNCEQAQGFYISRPVPVEEFELWLAATPGAGGGGKA